MGHMIGDYQTDPLDRIEKSLTNFNVNTALIKEQVIEISRSHKKSNANFIKQYELLLEEVVKLKIEGRMIREEIKKFM